MAWLKELDLATARAELRELAPGDRRVLRRRRRKPNPLGLPRREYEVTVFCVDGAWRDEPREFIHPLHAGAPRVDELYREAALVHGATCDAGDRAFVFLEHVDAPVGVAGWLEGLDRGLRGAASKFETHDGELRRIELRGGALPLDLQLVHVLSLRAARTIEELAIDLSPYLPAAKWQELGRIPLWRTARFPSTLRTLRVHANQISCIETRQCADGIRAALPGIVVEG